MTSRNLTDVFIMMRNNSMQSRQFYNEQQLNDRAALVEESLSRNEVEIGLPPLWTDQLEECQYALSRLEVKIRELDSLHEQNVQRPQAFSDCTENHQQINVLTKEINRMFLNCHKLVDSIKSQSIGSGGIEKQLAKNAMSSLVAALENSSNSFKSTQTKYIKTLRQREEKTSQYLSSLDTGQDEELDNIDLAFTLGGQQQLVMLEEENTRQARAREIEVERIMQSILDLNDVFKDLAHLISDQGTVLDRIDYNLEQSSVRIQDGFKQLQKAERYQQKNRKLTCIFALAASTLLMFILLVVLKFN